MDVYWYGDNLVNTWNLQVRGLFKLMETLMVWGVCSWCDMRHLTGLDTTLTSDRYVSILSDHLHPFISIVHSDGLREFQQAVTSCIAIHQ
ncbi:hypothetical protein TNCV_1989441 [Trichonephila clavipes]|nr:hypothetical protein TNCV_1989441 [Trichonephila clavipes]